jgi:hypothetical protein
MIEKIGAVILLIIGIFTAGILKGKRDEKNKQNKKAIDSVKNSKRIDRANDKLSRADKLRRL